MSPTFDRLLSRFAHDTGSAAGGLCHVSDVLPDVLAHYGLAEHVAPVTPAIAFDEREPGVSLCPVSC